MSRRLRIGIVILLAGIGLAAAGFYILTILLRQTIAPLPAPTAPPPLTQRVVAATHNIPLGAIIKSEDLRILDVPVDLAPPGVITQPEAATGRIAKVQLVTGELVMQHHLADPTNIANDLGFVMDDNHVLMAFPATDLMSSLSILKRGDVIDILASIKEKVVVEPAPGEATSQSGETGTIDKVFTFSAMQRVQITAMVVDILNDEQRSSITLPDMQTTPAAPGSQEVPASQPAPATKTRAYLLALPAQDALVLKYLIDTQSIIDIVLRSPTSTTSYEVTPVTSEYVLDRYLLEVPRR